METIGQWSIKLGKKSRSFRVWARRVGFFLVAIGTIYFVLALASNLADMPTVKMTPSALVAGLFSLTVVPMTAALLALLFRILLDDLGVVIRWSAAFRIIALSQMAKYLPGNIGHFVGRAALARAQGLPLGPVISVTLLEVIWTLALGLGIAAIALLLLLDTPLRGPFDLLNQQWVILGLAGALALAPWPAIALLNRVSPGLSRRLGNGVVISRPKALVALVTAAILLSCFCLLGASAFFQARYFFAIDAGELPSFIMLFATAWVAGYVTPGAPGGLGVREAALLVLFSPILGPAGAVSLGISSRVLTTLGDGLTFLLGLVFRARG